MRKRFGSSMTAAVAAVAVFAAPASAATLANWEMNEGPRAKVMVDKAGHVNGTIGSAISDRRTSSTGATGLRLGFHEPHRAAGEAERIAQANSSTLNPARATTQSRPVPDDEHFGNIVQKGRAGSSGGYFKLENPTGA